MPAEGEPGVLFRRVFNDEAPPVITPPAEISPLSEGSMTLEGFKAHIAGLYAVTDNVNATVVITLDPAALSGGGTLLPGKWDFTVAAYDFAGNEADPVHAQITVTPVDPSLLIPEIAYSGGLTLTAAQGKSAAETESAVLAQTAVYDNDAPPAAFVAFSDGAMDANGALLAGNHTVTIDAVDSDGNSAVPVVLDLLVRGGTDFSSDYNGNPRMSKGYSIGPLETINTWSAWIRIMPDPDNNRGNATPTRYGYILGQWEWERDGNSAASSMSFDIRPGGRPCVNWGDVMYQFANVDVRTGEYLFLTVTRDTAAKGLRCYVNGELRQTLAFVAGATINTDLVPQGDFWIGRDKPPTYLDSVFMGEIASVHIFGVARTQEEIKADMLGVDSGAAGVLYSAYIVPDDDRPDCGGDPCVCDSCACDNGGECTGGLCPCRPDDGGESGESGGDGGGRGCSGCRDTAAAALFIPLVAAAVLFISRRKYS
ncbi:MAG: LamG domain-containing protein [Clostridiales bacterium]|nr:LamG domain-containing protein [Clostridiales bacterium]